jgi:S-adenosylmethionine synthetase
LPTCADTLWVSDQAGMRKCHVGGIFSGEDDIQIDASAAAAAEQFGAKRVHGLQAAGVNEDFAMLAFAGQQLVNEFIGRCPVEIAQQFEVKVVAVLKLYDSEIDSHFRSP